MCGFAGEAELERTTGKGLEARVAFGVPLHSGRSPLQLALPRCAMGVEALLVVGQAGVFQRPHVDRITEVALSDNADLDNAVAANEAAIAAHATRADRSETPFWPLLFSNVTLRPFGSDDFPAEAKRQAASGHRAAPSAAGESLGQRRPRRPFSRAAWRVR